MGWAAGSSIMNNIIYTMKREVGDTKIREKVYKDFIEYFEDEDCDTLEECIDIDEAFDKVYYRLYPKGD